MRTLLIVYSMIATVFLFACASMRMLLTFDQREYQPERHYMRGPGPKWREKNLGKIAAP